MQDKIPKKLLLIIVLVYAAVFLLALRNTDYVILPDSNGYVELSQSLLNHQSFSRLTPDGLKPEFFRMPVYPLFLSFTQIVPVSLHVLVPFLQCLLAPLVAILVWPMLIGFGGRKGAMVGESILFLDYVVVMHAPVALTEMVFHCGLVTGLFLLWRFVTNPQTKEALVAGLMWGLLSLIKPIAIVILAIGMIPILLTHFRRGVLFGLIAFSLPGLWVLRNYHHSGHPFFTIQGGYAMLLYPAAHAKALGTGMPVEAVVAELQNEIARENPGVVKDSYDEASIYQQKAQIVMNQYFWQTVKWHVIGAVRILGGTGMEMLVDLVTIHNEKSQGSKETMTGMGTMDLLRKYPVLVFPQLGYMVFLLLVYCGFLVGEKNLWFSNKKWWSVFFLGAVMALLVVSAHQGYYRYRIPLMPFLALGTAASFRKERPASLLD